MIIKGERIYLRKPQSDDVDDMLRWENDEEVWEVSDNREPFTRKDIESFVASGLDLEKDKQLRFMICEHESGRRLGCIDLFDFDPHHQRAGVGILIYDKSDRQQGFGSESLRILTEHCRTTMKMKQLHCAILSNNKASLALFNACGFVNVGTRKAWRKVGHTWMDELIMQCIFD